MLGGIVREPTQQGNILDLVITNNETLVSQVEVGARFNVSDHHEIRFKINAVQSATGQLSLR